jgi:zinc transport system ATP-binding protein
LAQNPDGALGADSGAVTAVRDDVLVFSRVSVARGRVNALSGVTAHVPRGACTAVVGPNGAGKTTLLLALLGELAYRGRIALGPRPDGKPARIGYVPQSLRFDRGMPISVTEFLCMGLQRRPLWLGVARGPRNAALALLAAVKAGHLADRGMGALSGGEAQRVLLALALARRPDLLVLDEPAAGVDPHGEMLFCELLEALRRESGFTQLMVTHDLGMVTHHADHVICLNRTVIAEGAPRDVLTGNTLVRLFGMHMGLLDAGLMPGSHCAACHDAGCGIARDAAPASEPGGAPHA